MELVGLWNGNATTWSGMRSRLSAELQRRPRGGGRDRDRIAPHTVAKERDWAKQLVVFTLQEAMPTEERLSAHRDAYYHAFRALYAQGKVARTWALRFLIRHNAFHAMDHAWKLEDKDLTAKRA